MAQAQSKKTPLWLAIANALRSDIAEGRYGPGDKLPTEAELSERFSVNRHTVRHAQSHLVEEGMIYTRRGSGAYVMARPTEYPIGSRVRFHKNLEAAGRIPDKQRLDVEVRATTAREADSLGLKHGDSICIYRGLSFSDGQPIALFESHFPEARFPGIAASLRVQTSVTAALKSVGIDDYERRLTRVSAKSADATQAVQLRTREGAALIYATSVNVSMTGEPVEIGMTWFVGERVTLTLGQAS